MQLKQGINSYCDISTVTQRHIDFGFIGGSMGAAVGERFVVAAQVALDEKIPFVCHREFRRGVAIWPFRR